eukprot:gene842-1326_t
MLRPPEEATVVVPGVTTAPRFSQEEEQVGDIPADTGDSAELPWQWSTIVMDLLGFWDQVDSQSIEIAEARVSRAVTAARVQWINKRFFVKDVRALWFARQYTASAKLTLLHVLRTHPEIPDFDIVLNQGDYPVLLTPRNIEHFTYMYNSTMPGPMFSPTSSSSTLDLAWPDFSFMPPLGNHELVTPRWDVARPSVLRAGAQHPWEAKLDFAAWTGNPQAGTRKQLKEVVLAHPDKILMNAILFKTPPGKRSCVVEGKYDKPGFQENQCGLSFEELCRYKYLINVGSNGYANKLKYLFLCGSVVLYVRQGSPNHEFFELQLLPGTHYWPVETPEDLPAAIDYLQAHPALAKRIGTAGTARMRHMDMGEVSNYLSTVLTQYSQKLRFKPTRLKGSFEVNCEDDLWRHYNIDGSLLRFVTEDNSTCLRRPEPEDLVAPGWGGAYQGSFVDCKTANDLVEVPDACNPDVIRGKTRF